MRDVAARVRYDLLWLSLHWPNVHRSALLDCPAHVTAACTPALSAPAWAELQAAYVALYSTEDSCLPGLAAMASLQDRLGQLRAGQATDHQVWLARSKMVVEAHDQLRHTRARVADLEARVSREAEESPAGKRHRADRLPPESGLMANHRALLGHAAGAVRVLS